MMKELVFANRSHRRFYEDRAVSREALVDLIELARLIPSAGNKQPLKYILSCDRKKNSAIFQSLAWAAYLKDWPGPAEGERPSGYILILGDTEIADTVPWDHAIAAQTIALGAVEKGLRSCILASVNKGKLQDELRIPRRFEILLVVALGYPKETVVIDEIRDGDYKYWRDEKGIHHVPKRPLEDLILDV